MKLTNNEIHRYIQGGTALLDYLKKLKLAEFAHAKASLMDCLVSFIIF